MEPGDHFCFRFYFHLDQRVDAYLFCQYVPFGTLIYKEAKTKFDGPFSIRSTRISSIFFSL